MIKGGCRCGKVQYEADGAISDLSHCHCSMGTVDGNPNCPPDYHQFAASKAPGHEITDGKPQHDTWRDD
jgi:hypothetical protein